MKNTYIKLAIGILLFATWLSLILFGVRGAEDLITAIKASLFGLGVYHMGDRPGPPPAPTGNAGGFASPILLIAMAAGVLLLSGCASVQQGIQAYGKVAVTSAQAADDTLIEGEKLSMCALPYSALQRHQEMQPAVVVLCGPLTAQPVTVAK